MSSPRRWYTRLEAGEALPAFVVGFEVPDATRSGSLAARLPEALLPSVQVHGHQFGGLVCLQSEVLGLTLRLQANRHQGRGSLPLEVLHAQLSADPSLPVAHPALAWLREFVPSAGQELDAREREQLEAALKAAVPGLPSIDSAREAFVRFQGTGGELFLGWKAFTVLAASDDGPTVLDDWDLSTLSCADELELSVAQLLALEDFGRQEGLGPPRTFLLWNNSD